MAGGRTSSCCSGREDVLMGKVILMSLTLLASFFFPASADFTGNVVGVWVDAEPVPPWEWRREKK